MPIIPSAVEKNPTLPNGQFIFANGHPRIQLFSSDAEKLFNVIAAFKTAKDFSDSAYLYAKDGKLWIGVISDSTPTITATVPIIEIDFDDDKDLYFNISLKGFYDLSKKLKNVTRLCLAVCKDSQRPEELPAVLQVYANFRQKPKSAEEDTLVTFKTNNDQYKIGGEKEWFDHLKYVNNLVENSNQDIKFKAVLTADNFRSAISSVEGFVSGDPYREHLHHATFLQIGDNVAIAGTDGHRLSLYTFPKPYVFNKTEGKLGAGVIHRGFMQVFDKLHNALQPKSVKIQTSQATVDKKTAYGKQDKAVHSIHMIEFNDAVFIADFTGRNEYMHETNEKMISQFVTANNIDNKKRKSEVMIHYENLARLHKIGKAFSFYKDKRHGKTLDIVCRDEAGNIDLVMGNLHQESEYVKLDIGTSALTQTRIGSLVKLNIEYLQDAMLEIKKFQSSENDPIKVSFTDALSPIMLTSGPVSIAVMPMR